MKDDLGKQEQQRQFHPVSQHGLEGPFYQDGTQMNNANNYGDYQSGMPHDANTQNAVGRNAWSQLPAQQNVLSTISEMPTAMIAVPSSQELTTSPSDSRTPASVYPNHVKQPASKKKVALIVISVLGVLILLGGGGLAYMYHKLAPPDVTLYRVSMQNASQNIGAGGLVYPRQSIDFSYPYAVRVISVLVKPGDQVTANEPLIQLDLSQINASQLTQLSAQVAQAAQDLASAQSYLNSVLPLGNPVVTAQAQHQYDTALSKYNALVAQSGASTLRQGSLVAPISGTVTAVNVSAGQFSNPARVMLTVYDESSVIVRIKVPLASYNQIHLNQSVQVTPSALPGQVFTGVVMAVIPKSDAQTDTFEVWVSVLNKNFSLLPGMSTFVSLQNIVRTLVVPRLAVLNPDRDSIVYIVRNGHAYIQHVQIAGYSGDSILIKTGLSADDQILLVGLDGLQDGRAVHVTKVEG